MIQTSRRVGLPIAEVSEHSAQEKSIRHGTLTP
ncbi:MAG: DUF1156 domain-containing protein [Nitrospinae bacterium]|nr:DUF1156 domain-containing protein [Nitrospinota bacterium]